MLIETVTSLEDPRLADYRNLRDRDLHRAGSFIVEGRQNVRVLLSDSPFTPRSILVNQPALDSLDDPAQPLSIPESVPVYLAGQPLLDAVVGFHIHRGCLASVTRPVPTTAAELLDSLPPAPNPCTVLFLEDILNHDNVGALFRATASFSACAILITPQTCDPLYRKSVRVSMGHALRIPFAQTPGTPGLFELFAKHNFTTLALTPCPEVQDITAFARNLSSTAQPHRFCLLLGSEGPGLSSPLLSAANHTLRIPINQSVDSLNVATAAAIALHTLNNISPSTP